MNTTTSQIRTIILDGTLSKSEDFVRIDCENAEQANLLFGLLMKLVDEEAQNDARLVKEHADNVAWDEYRTTMFNASERAKGGFRGH